MIKNVMEAGGGGKNDETEKGSDEALQELFTSSIDSTES